MEKIKENSTYNPAGGRPARPGHVRQQDQRADVHGLPVGGRADRRALRRSGPALHRHDPQVVHVHQRRPRRLARSVYVSTGCTTSWSCTSPTRRRSINSAVVQAAAPVIYDEAMGLPKTDLVTLPPDPIQEQLTYESALAAFEALPEIRVLFDNGAGSLADRHARRPAIHTRASNSRSPKFPIPGTKAQSWYLGPGGTLNEQQPTAEGVDSYTSDANATPLTDFSAQHRLGRPVGQRVAVGMELGAAPGGLRGVLRVGAAHEQHHRDRRRRRAPLGRSHRLRTSISRRRSARCVPTATRRSSRTAGSGRASASSPPTRTTCSSRSPRCSSRSRRSSPSDVEPMPANEFVPVTIPLYFEGHAYRAGSRIRVTISAPNGTQPIWSFSQTQPAGTHRDGVDRLLAEHAVEPDPPDRAGRQRADGAARLPEPAQRAVPPLPGDRQRRLVKVASAARHSAARRRSP